ncbi:MAG TPA: S26 family signal peptidase [Gemmataceae bacterium]|nr:S26 family signal peptidase [Gemmataceae bacterium]
MKNAFRRFLETILLVLCALLLFRAVGAEPYGVPTGSMAPTLLGNHKAVLCPRCGDTVRVGSGDHGDQAAGAACPNCGCPDLGLDRVPVCRGDRLLVNKTFHEWRSPRRWEMAIFLSPVDQSKIFVKRVVGLPGESVQVRDGDVYVDHEIARKTLTELKAVRVPVFDNNFQPADGWAVRWLTQPDRGPALRDGPRLRLEAEGVADTYQWLVYRHTFATTDKARPVFDEYAYNGSDPTRTPEPVHDFMIDCDLEVRAGDGWLALGLNDGGSEVVVEFPVGALKDGTHLSEWPAGGAGGEQTVYRTAPTFGLRTGRTYHVEFAFADRRASLTVDGRGLFAPVDRPSLPRRAEVVKPARIGARGVEVVVQNFRLFRDVHYTAAGRHAGAAPVRLGAGQYFVLGDNSPNSDDSRFWSDGAGRPLPVPEASFLGKPFLLHQPSRIEHSADGRRESRVDWGRIRWLH